MNTPPSLSDAVSTVEKKNLEFVQKMVSKLTEKVEKLRQTSEKIAKTSLELQALVGRIESETPKVLSSSSDLYPQRSSSNKPEFIPPENTDKKLK